VASSFGRYGRLGRVTARRGRRYMSWMMVICRVFCVRWSQTRRVISRAVIWGVVESTQYESKPIRPNVSTPAVYELVRARTLNETTSVNSRSAP
jgi:hypothetical protein